MLALPRKAHSWVRWSTLQPSKLHVSAGISSTCRYFSSGSMATESDSIRYAHFSSNSSTFLSMIYMQEWNAFSANVQVTLYSKVLLVSGGVKGLADLKRLKHWQSLVPWGSTKANAVFCMRKGAMSNSGTDWKTNYWKASLQKGIWECWLMEGSVWVRSMPWQPSGQNYILGCIKRSLVSWS